jgi:hypothetical protein
MNERDDVVRRALERLHVPPESSGFFDELWERAQAREQAATRRWRRISLALAVVALAAIASAAVLAAAPSAATNVIDVRGVCPSGIQGGLPVFTVHAEPGDRPEPGASPIPHPPPGFFVQYSVYLTTVGLEGRFFGLSSLFSGYQLDRRGCPATRARIDLSHKGMANEGTFVHGDYTSFHQRCVDVARFAFRVRITTNTDGVPTKAELAVVRAKTGTPLVYVLWTPEKVTGWSTPRCQKTAA